MPAESIGQILLHTTDLTADQLDQALRYQQTRRPHAELGRILLEKEWITDDQFYQALAQQWLLPFISEIHPDRLQPRKIKQIPLTFLKAQHILPITDPDHQFVIAISDPLQTQAYDAILNHMDGYYPRVLCPPEQIDQALSRCYYQQTSSKSNTPQKSDAANSSNRMDNPLSAMNPEDLNNFTDQSPIVKLVNTIFFQAVQSRASDIHIEAYEDRVNVRFRIDGVLHDVFSPPRHQFAALISRLKIMANLNIAEKRLPQDGQSRIKIGQRQMDIRVSIIPTSGGERAVLRLLDKGGMDLTLEQIGFDRDTGDQFSKLIESPHGIILITGPTGSGKTTTLYSVIQQINNHQRNILTVEDPIEYQLTGIGQMQVKPSIDLTFANCLRHILRQDPDVIMIGEIRDLETAEIAMHASLTGHLVLSTLHTNDAASAVTRLSDMGIEPYLIASSVITVMAQRLVRNICPQCKTPCRTEHDLNNMLSSDHPAIRPGTQFYTGTGCEYCFNTGFYGRTGIFELLLISDTIKDQIVQRQSAGTIKKTALTEGMTTLRDDGLNKALNGITTISEVLRVTQDNNSDKKINIKQNL